MARRLSGILPVRRPRLRIPTLTLFGRSVLLLAAELLANAVCWIVCAILFSRRPATRPVLSLALLAWVSAVASQAVNVLTFNAFDATFNTDCPFAIDNATRSLINLGQLPVTCGLFFSLGHSTIVIVVNVAIAISTDVYDHIDGVGEVGGIVGAAVSATFLFIVGLANSIILYRILRKRYRLKKERAARAARGEEALVHNKDDNELDEEPHRNTLMMRLIGPVVTFVDRPWKMYPVGVLFGFGFDTASSIALLAISAIAKRDPDGGEQINPADIVILPLLFTVGMTLIDSLDSIIMLYSYAGFPERSFAIFERRPPATNTRSVTGDMPPLPHAAESPSRGCDAKQETEAAPVAEVVRTENEKHLDEKTADVVTVADPDEDSESELARRRTLRVKHNAMSNLSILLTVMSIMVAFSISLITTMGLIGDHCTPCQNAANAEDGGGLAGRWWRGWANANDNSGYIGAAIVGSFVFVVSSWYGARFLYRKWQRRQARH